jgi:hypothetical protein
MKIKNDSELPYFALLRIILIIKNTPYFICQYIRDIKYVSHYHAFKVETDTVFNLVELKQIDYGVYHSHLIDNSHYIALRELQNVP